MLYDTTFPLLNKEVERAEFDRKVQENPLNDHLKVKGLQTEERAENLLPNEQIVSTIKADKDIAVMNILYFPFVG